MAMLKAPPLPVDVQKWKRLSHIDRIRPLMLRWVEYGSEVPPVIHIFYVLKLAAYIFGGLAIIAATPGIGGISGISQWFHEPIVYQKAAIFTWLIEIVGLGGSCGPLMFKYLPPVLGFLHWLRPGTVRQPPWPKVVPLTRGTRRGVFDAALFGISIALMIALLASPGTEYHPPGASVGLLPASLIIPLLVAQALLGLRDKVVFLSGRAEMYWVASVIFLFPYDQMMIGLKFALVFIWLGAAISKFTHHFPYVVSIMTSNAPLRPKWFKRMMYQDFPRDVRPSRFAFLLAHCGTVIELVAPVVMLVSQGGLISAIAVGIVVLLHLNIISFIPVAVPNEWNVFMIFGAIFLYWTHADASVLDLRNPLLIAFLTVVLVFPVVLGNFRPDLVSFLPAMRYYAGNWAVGLWCFRDESVIKLHGNIRKTSDIMEEQVEKLFGADTAHIANYRVRAWRSLHAQGRALNGIMARALDDVDRYTVLDGEPLTGSIMGWNMGDGHMHNAQLLGAVQERCHFAPGELVLVYIESQPIHRHRQRYHIIDAATGELETGYVRTSDMFARQPWDDTPFPVDVIGTSRAPGAAPRTGAEAESA